MKVVQLNRFRLSVFLLVFLVIIAVFAAVKTPPPIVGAGLRPSSGALEISDCEALERLDKLTPPDTLPMLVLSRVPQDLQVVFEV